MKLVCAVICGISSPSALSTSNSTVYDTALLAAASSDGAPPLAELLKDLKGHPEVAALRRKMAVLQDPGFAQPAHALERGGRGNADPGGQVLVRQPRILSQKPQYGEVCSVQMHIRPPIRK